MGRAKEGTGKHREGGGQRKGKRGNDEDSAEVGSSDEG